MCHQSNIKALLHFSDVVRMWSWINQDVRKIYVGKYEIKLKSLKLESSSLCSKVCLNKKNFDENFPTSITIFQLNGNKLDIISVT